ncbi:MAG: 30S ribosomal protein S17e [archaeon]|nr:30S ribosomal protein S17e [archaeon]
MGKAVPQNIKSKANLLMQTYGDEVPADFESAKRFIDGFKMPLSKPQRNLVAGFISRKKGKLKA